MKEKKNILHEQASMENRKWNETYNENLEELRHLLRLYIMREIRR